LEQKELKLPYNGKEEIFTIGKIGFGDFNEIHDECIPAEMVGQQTKASMKMGRFRTLTVLKGLKKAPFDITEENIKKLNADIGLKLFNEINIFNTFEESKKSS